MSLESTPGADPRLFPRNGFFPRGDPLRRAALNSFEFPARGPVFFARALGRGDAESQSEGMERERGRRELDEGGGATGEDTQVSGGRLMGY